MLHCGPRDPETGVAASLPCRFGHSQSFLTGWTIPSPHDKPFVLKMGNGDGKMTSKVLPPELLPTRE